MIALTDRLQLIADEINIGESMADIGTDHGFLPIYLWENKISPKVIMADVSRGSLDKARDNCRMLYPEENFDLRLGNGLEVLKNGEVSDIVIAGMGGILMTQIMSADMAKTKSFKKYILQPRISSGRLRSWLLANGFSITGDRLVREGRFICNVITAVTELGMNLPELQANLPEFQAMAEDDIRLEIPVWLAAERLGAEFIQRRINSEKDILKNLMNSKDNDKQIIVNKNIEYLEGLLGQLPTT